MEEKLNFQVPAEDLELVILLHTQYTANVLLIISIDFAYDQLSPYSLTILFRRCCLYKLQSILSTYYDISLKFL